ncbi:MAG: site-2 protease family protein [Patescibacteria group bacterium]|nr:site-2 protease family protein [Patescibacteria group bacterium]
MIINIIIFLVLLSVLVLIHELGHFLVAKKLKIKVEEFGFGIPPRIFGIKKGETVYSINWLLMGGFVKLFGEDEAGAGSIKIKDQKSKIKNIKDKKRAFFARPVWQRASVVLAGVIMNTLLAAFLFYIFLFVSNFKTDLPLLSDHKFFLVNQYNRSEIFISEVSKNSPAEKAGITQYSKVISINGEKVDNTKKFLEIVNQNKGKEIVLEWQNEKTKKISKVMIVPRKVIPKGEGPIGVSFFPVSTATLFYETPMQKIFSGVVHPINLLAYNFDVMGQLISASIKEKTAGPLSESVSGPVGIYSLVGTINQIPDFKEKILQFLNLAGLLSISLAFFNILPFPALDGGRLLFIVIEGLTGRKVPVKYESYAHAVGMAILLALIALVTIKDITKIFTGGIFPNP